MTDLLGFGHRSLVTVTDQTKSHTWLFDSPVPIDFREKINFCVVHQMEKWLAIIEGVVAAMVVVAQALRTCVTSSAAGVRTLNSVNSPPCNVKSEPTSEQCKEIACEPSGL